MSSFMSTQATLAGRELPRQEWTIHPPPPVVGTLIWLALKGCWQVEVCRVLIPASITYRGAQGGRGPLALRPQITTGSICSRKRSQH